MEYNIEASNVNREKLLKLTNTGNELDIHLQNNTTSFTLGLKDNHYIIKNDTTTYKSKFDDYTITNTIENINPNIFNDDNENDIYYTMGISYNMINNRETEKIYNENTLKSIERNSSILTHFNDYTFYDINFIKDTDKPIYDAGFMFNIKEKTTNTDINFKITLKSIEFNIPSKEDYIIKKFKLYAVINKTFNKYDCYLLLDDFITIESGKVSKKFIIPNKIYTDKFIIIVNEIQELDGLRFAESAEDGRLKFKIDNFTLEFDNKVKYENFNLDFSDNSILNLKLLNTQNIFIDNTDISNYILNKIVENESAATGATAATVAGETIALNTLKNIIKLHFSDPVISNKLLNDETIKDDYESSYLYEIIKSLFNIHLENDDPLYNSLPNLGNNHTNILNSEFSKTFIVGIRKIQDVNNSNFNFKFYYDGDLTTKHLIDLNNINKSGLLYFNENNNIIECSSNLIDSITIKKIDFESKINLKWDSNLNNFQYYNIYDENNELQPKICDLFSIEPKIDDNFNNENTGTTKIEIITFNNDYKIKQPVVISKQYADNNNYYLLNYYKDLNLFITGLLGFGDNKIRKTGSDSIIYNGETNDLTYNINENYSNLDSQPIIFDKDNLRNFYKYQVIDDGKVDYFEYERLYEEELIDISFEILDNLEDYLNFKNDFKNKFYIDNLDFGNKIDDYGTLIEYTNSLNKLGSFNLYIDDILIGTCNISDPYEKQLFNINQKCRKVKIEFNEIYINLYQHLDNDNIPEYNNCIILKDLKFKFKTNFNCDSLKIFKPLNIDNLTIDKNLEFNNDVDIKFKKNINSNIGEKDIFQLELENLYSEKTCILKNSLEIGDIYNFSKIYLDNNVTPIINITNHNSSNGFIGINMSSDELESITDKEGLIVKSSLKIYENSKSINLGIDNLTSTYTLKLPQYDSGIDKYLKIYQNANNIIETQWSTLSSADFFTAGHIYLGNSNLLSYITDDYKNYSNSYNSITNGYRISSENLIHIRKLFVGPDDDEFFSNTDNANINTIINENSLTVAGQIYATTDIYTDSDLSYKYDLEKIIDVKDKINSLTGYTFNRNDTFLEKRFTGLIAQDVEKVLPEAVLKKCDGKLRVMYGNLAGLFIEGFKDLYNEIDMLKRELNSCKERL